MTGRAPACDRRGLRSTASRGGRSKHHLLLTRARPTPEQNNEGWTPLAFAARGAPKKDAQPSSWLKLAEALLAAGASTSPTTSKGFQPLHCAPPPPPTKRIRRSPHAAQSHAPRLTLFLPFQNRLRPHSTLSRGAHPIPSRTHAPPAVVRCADACASNHATVVAALLRAGADAAAATKAGIRPLHVAAFLGFDDCVEILVRRRLRRMRLGHHHDHRKQCLLADTRCAPRDMSAAHASRPIHTDGARRVAREAGRRRRPHRAPLRRGARHARPAEQAARSAHRGGARLAAPRRLGAMLCSSASAHPPLTRCDEARSDPPRADPK